MHLIDYSTIRIEKKVASGATASVFRATVNRTQVVALKRFICDELDIDQAQRFMQEASKMRFELLKLQLTQQLFKS